MEERELLRADNGKWRIPKRQAPCKLDRAALHLFQMVRGAPYRALVLAPEAHCQDGMRPQRPVGPVVRRAPTRGTCPQRDITVCGTQACPACTVLHRCSAGVCYGPHPRTPTAGSAAVRRATRGQPEDARVAMGRDVPVMPGRGRAAVAVGRTPAAAPAKAGGVGDPGSALRLLGVLVTPASSSSFPGKPYLPAKPG